MPFRHRPEVTIVRKLRFSYRMELEFCLTANHHRFSVKCLPASDEMQNLLDCRMDIIPRVPLSYSVDAFGNRIIYGLIEQPHRKFSVKLSGTADCGMQSGHEIRPQTLALYRYQSTMTKPGKALFQLRERAFSSFAAVENLSEVCSAAFGDRKIFLNEAQVLQLGDALTQYLYQSMRYAPGETDTETTAEESAALMSGVCQDYSHIMLSLFRMYRVPCRYCVGLMCGEGASHAWVEAAAGERWIGFDPTNGRRVDDSYLYISFGRDAKDCLMNRGVFTGGGAQTQRVYAVLEEE